MFYPSTGSTFCSKPGATPDGTSLDITDIEQNYINNYKVSLFDIIYSSKISNPVENVIKFLTSILIEDASTEMSVFLKYL